MRLLARTRDAEGRRRGRDRSNDYDVPVVDDEGKRWRLRGHKDVSRRAGVGPWRATTQLATVLEPDDGGGPPAADAERWSGTGTLRITPVGAARLVASIRATGLLPGGRGRAFVHSLARIGRFGLFFARGAIEPFVGGRRDG